MIRTLVVDDEPDMRELVETLISAWNRNLTVVGVAAGGLEALQQASSLEPNVVVLDQRMPGMTGVETARELRRRHPATRLILYSAWPDEVDADEAAAAGISQVISKSDFDGLRRALRSA